MPAISKLSLPAEFEAAHAEARTLGETNDCAVKAIVIATGKPYAEVHAVLKELGRVDRKGTPMQLTEKALHRLGFRFRRWGGGKFEAMIRSYPGVHGRVLKNITTHHPRRFKAAWAGEAKKVLLLRTANHILCLRDGEVKDWSINRALQVIDIIEVEI